MINLIKFLIFGHIHKWKVIKEHGYMDYWGTIGNKEDLMASGKQYILQCENCGNLKKWKD